MDICRHDPPQLFMPDTDRAAACFLYRDAPVLDTREITRVFDAQISATRVA
jgi:hypothetical protein